MRLPETKFYEDQNGDPRSSSVTVAVSLFNYENHIGECLASVARQDLENLNLIVVDDCSTDDSTDAAITWFEANKGRFRHAMLVGHPKNRGLAEARNTAFRHAVTDYVFVLDADNCLYPPAIRKLLAAIQGTQLGAAYSQLEFFGHAKGLGYSDIWGKNLFQKMNYIDAMALVSVDAWRRVGGYSHIEGGWEDWDFWCKFIDHGIDALFVPEILCKYRVHLNSMLRTETSNRHNIVAGKMMIRHPWLKIEFVG